MSTSDGGSLDEALAAIDDALTAGDPPTALGHAEKALRRFPEEPELHHARGVALRAMDRWDDALEAFRVASEFGPHLADAWLDAAEILLEEEDDPISALDLLDAALGALEEQAPRAEVHLLRGIALAHLESGLV